MIVATHEGMTLRRLDKDRYCLSNPVDQVGRCHGAIIGRNEARAILDSWSVKDAERALDAA